jgi:hypothetical protein
MWRGNHSLLQSRIETLAATGWLQSLQFKLVDSYSGSDFYLLLLSMTLFFFADSPSDIKIIFLFYADALT